MGIGGSGVSIGGTTVSAASSMGQLVEMARFFGDREAVLARMAELATKEAEVDAKLSALGGLERAKDLIAEAEDVRRRADGFRTTTVDNAREEADRLKREARAERADAEAIRKRAQNEFANREEKVEADERDIGKRKKDLTQAEALVKSKQEKLNIAQQETDALGNKLQAKLNAIKKAATE